MTGIAEPQQVAEVFCINPETMCVGSIMDSMDGDNGIDMNVLWNSAVAEEERYPRLL